MAPSFYEALMSAIAGPMHAFLFRWKEGYFSHEFGPNYEYELALEPVAGGLFVLALYRNKFLVWPHKLSVAPGYAVPQGPGEEYENRRKEMREHLVWMLQQLDKADAEAAAMYPVKKEEDNGGAPGVQNDLLVSKDEEGKRDNQF